MPTISQISARQVLDSRGNPTVEAEVKLDDGSSGLASVPSGASTGSHEALELRDNDPAHFFGKGVEKAVETIKTTIAAALKNNDPTDQVGCDNELVLRDGTDTLSNLGANAILSVSLAISKAAAASKKIPLYHYIHQLYQNVVVSGNHLSSFSVSTFSANQNQVNLLTAPTSSQPRMPIPFFNVLNGGAHTNWQTTHFQEFMIVPVAAASFKMALEQGSEVYHSLQSVLKQKGYSTLVGDEGGFAPALKTDEEALELLLIASQQAGLTPGKDIMLALDPATSELYKDGVYHFHKLHQTKTTRQMIELWQSWVNQYPILSLEDGLAEDDWSGWQQLYQSLAQKVLLVGDDFLVTNPDRIVKAIAQKTCSGLLMKLNQIGTLSESLQAIHLARNAGWKIIVSHRSGETEDTAIADIAVGVQAEYVKMGAPARSERTAKYNQLLRIEEQLQTTR